MPLQHITTFCVSHSQNVQNECEKKRWKKRRRRKKEISEICVMEPFKRINMLEEKIYNIRRKRSREREESCTCEKVEKLFLNTRDVKKFFFSGIPNVSFLNFNENYSQSQRVIRLRSSLKLYTGLVSRLHFMNRHSSAWIQIKMYFFFDEF